MTPIDKLPELQWNDIALEEMLAGETDDLVATSEVAYRVGNLAVAGLIYHTFLQPPWFWFALAKGVTIRDLLDFRRLKERIPHGALTAVNIKHHEAIRFAELYGFERTGKMEVHNDKTYLIFRRT